MDPEQVLVAGMMLAVMVLIGKVVIPIANAYARRVEAKGDGLDERRGLAELEARVHELELREARVAELEERLDFTERLIAQQRDGGRLGAGEQR